MPRSKRTPHTRSMTPVQKSRIYAHTSPTYSMFRSQSDHKRRAFLRSKSGKPQTCEEGFEDTYHSSLRGTDSIEVDENLVGTDIESNSDDDAWDEETTLIEMLSSPKYSEEQIFHSLSRVFADASQAVRKEVILDIRPVLSRTRNVRPAPGRAFVTGLLGFDDACKRFEKNSYRNAELDAAYAKIEDEIRNLFEQLKVAYTRLEERNVMFQKQVKEQTNKMREIISTLPADLDTLIAKLEREFEDTGKGDGKAQRPKRRERTVEGALTELQL